MSSTQIIEEIASCCSRRAGDQFAFVFDTVDPESRLSRATMSLFRDLARRTSRPVIVFSRSESNSEVPRFASLIDLGMMPLSEVRTSLLTASTFSGIEEQDRRALYAEVLTFGLDATHVAPTDAYDVLEAGLRRLVTDD